MTYIRKRRRGTAIVEYKKGILVTSGRGKLFILPGGKAHRNETRTVAAMRELKEETGLEPHSAKLLFRHVGGVHRSYHGGYFQDLHTVVLIKASGRPRPRKEVKHLAYYTPGCDLRISRTTKKIIEKYYDYKKSQLVGS